MRTRTIPPETYFAGSALFHYLGPAFAALLFAGVALLGVAGRRIVSAVTCSRRGAGRGGGRRRPTPRRCACSSRWGRCSPRSTAASTRRSRDCRWPRCPRSSSSRRRPGGGWSAFGAQRRRGCARRGRRDVPIDVRLRGGAPGLAWPSPTPGCSRSTSRSRTAVAGVGPGWDRWAPRGDAARRPGGDRAGGLGGRRHLPDPVALAAGVGVGVTSSVIPYVCHQLAMARLPGETYSADGLTAAGDRHRGGARRARPDAERSGSSPGYRSSSWRWRSPRAPTRTGACTALADQCAGRRSAYRSCN